MNPSTRTSHQKPFARASIQETIRSIQNGWNKPSAGGERRRKASDLATAARQVFNDAQQRAYEQGMKDAESSTRDHPPYGFSDLQQAWRMGWLAGSQKNKGLNSASRASRDRKSA